MVMTTHTYNYLWEIWLTSTITNLTRIHGRMSMSAPLILTYPADIEHVRKNEILGIVIIISMYDEEKQLKVVRKNGIHGTVCKQCCLSPWARQSQTSKE